MADYYISAVWKDSNGTITDYAVHLITTATKTFATKTTKTTKADAIKLVETTSNTLTTLVWNYTYGKWYVGGLVSVVNNNGTKYLKSAPDDKISDNLGHLICWNHFAA